MNDATAKLLRRVDAYLKRNPGIKETTLGLQAVNDGKAIGRLRAGGRFWPEKTAKLVAYMAANKHPLPKRAAQ